MTGPLTQQQLDQFDRDGFVVVRQFLSPQAVEQVVDRLRRFVAETVPEMPREYAFYEDKSDPGTLKQVQKMGDYDSFFHQLLHDGDLPAIARQVLRQAVTAENLQYFCKPPQVGRATPPHQDGYYFMLQPCAAVTMWLAIDRVDAENGCVRYVPGSHKLGMRPHHRTETLGFSQGIMDYPTEEDLSELAIPAEPGDLLVHHALTIHRADGNNSRQRTRRALGMVYFGEHAERDVEAHAAYQRQLTADMKASGKI